MLRNAFRIGAVNRQLLDLRAGRHCCAGHSLGLTGLSGPVTTSSNRPAPSRHSAGGNGDGAIVSLARRSRNLEPAPISRVHCAPRCTRC